MTNCPPCNLNCSQGDECPARYDMDEDDHAILCVLVAMSAVVSMTLVAIVGQGLGWW